MTHETSATQKSASPAPAGVPGVKPASARLASDSAGKAWLTSFAVIGDFGSVGAKKNNLSTEKSPANYVGEAIRRMAPDFIVSLGDDNYVEGKREWKDFNVGKNYAPYIFPYTVSTVNQSNPEATAFAKDTYLADQVPRRPWNRFFTAPGNHEVGMSGGVGYMEASGRRDWSHDQYYKAALEHSKAKGSVIPIADSYVKKGDVLYYDYSYGTSWMPATFGRKKEGAMDKSYYDYILKPINKDGVVLKDLANIFMVDRNNTAYGAKNTAYASWLKKNPGAKLDPQADFLMKEAQKRDSEVAWQIFGSHYQTYSSEGGLETMNLPYFANGIDLTVGSHVHNYERIRAKDSAGKQGDYIVNGAGGYNVSYYFSGKDWGASELFSPVNPKTPGHMAGSSGKWGFGWIDMNKDELMYRQFNVEFTQVKNSSALDKIIGIAVEGYTGKEPISEVKITEVDRLVLRKKPSGSGKVPAASTVPQTTSPDVSTRLVSVSPLSRSGRHATMPTGAEALDRSGSQPWQDCSTLLGRDAGSGLQALA